MDRGSTENFNMFFNIKGSGRQPEAGLQRRPVQPRGRFRRRPDGQEDDRGLRERHAVTAAAAQTTKGAARDLRAAPYETVKKVAQPLF